MKNKYCRNGLSPFYGPIQPRRRYIKLKEMKVIKKEEENYEFEKK